MAVENNSPELILINGRIATVDHSRPFAEAVAIQNGRFISVGSNEEIMRLRASNTETIDLGGRTVIPGLNDSHMHPIRGGLNYNMELRWDGVPSLADALRMLKEQAQRTPPPQWVRVVGGWTEFQFAERRMPTLEEINQAAPDTPVFVLHLYDRAFLHEGHARADRRRDSARQGGQSNRTAHRQAKRDDSLCHVGKRTEALARRPDEFDAALHARAQSLRRDQRH
jgi:predicted amidohydrolase YtcJ